jgi:hypothetical protein
MNVDYKPPSEDPFECRYLRDNFINCLEEKSRKDQLIARKCNLHFLPYFSLECPKDLRAFKTAEGLKQVYLEHKNGQYEHYMTQVLQDS